MKTRRGLWSSLGTVGENAAVLADWRIILGPEFEKTLPFLSATPEQGDSYPCTDRFPCYCRHEVVVHSPDNIVAACRCEQGDCRAIRLEPKDLVVYAVNVPKLGEAVRRTLGFDCANGAGQSFGPRTMRLGTHGPGRIPVLFHTPFDRDALLNELEGILATVSGPFILATPTASFYTATMEQMQHRQGFLLLPLSGTLALEDGGRLRLVQPIDAVLAEFTKRLAERPDTGQLLRGIHQEIAAVRTDFRDLRAAKQRLEQMLSEGLFAFTRNVDAPSFKVLCTILAEGDVAKASRTLGLGDSTLRDLLRQWSGQGRAYEAMLDIVRWRKKVGGKGTVPLNEAILHDKAPTADYPALLADVLDGMLSMTEDDWQERCEELAELLRPHVPR